MPQILRKANALTKPASIGVIAPASAPRSVELLTKGLENIRKAGFSTVQYRPTFESEGFLAGSDEIRLAEFNHFLQSKEVDALFSVRGGYGCLRLLDGIDYESARNHPKLLVGYSDITALQLALYKHAGWVGISGPMVAVEWPEPKESNCDQFLRLVGGGDVSGPLDVAEFPLTFMCTGRTTGTLLGGNLSLIAKMCGSKHLPDFTGSILFLEEIGESPYKIDGLLAQLKLNGILNKVSGIVLGGFTEAEPSPGRPTLSLETVFEHYFTPLQIPVAAGLRYGHFPKKIAIPIGVQAELISTWSNTELNLLESPVRG